MREADSITREVAERAAPAATILIIEDEEPIRRQIQALLSGAGYRVLAAADGQQALCLASEQPTPIDLVLTDISLPGITGPETVGRLQGLIRAFPVLYMSGNRASVLIHFGILRQTAAFLQKPFSPEEMLEKVASLLGAKA